MRKHRDLLLKAICAVLGALVLVQGVSLLRAKDPLDDTMMVQQTPTATSPDNPKESAIPGGGRSASKRGDVPPAIRTRIDAVVKSEIFGSIPRPLPMALLGIAGHDALIRTATGQTGLLRVNEELGGVKLLQIGTNRVLVEHEGTKKELMLFGGYGGETLLPKEESK